MSVSEADLAKAIAAYKQGGRVSALAAGLKVAPSTLYREFAAAGVEMRRPTGRPPHPPEIRERVLELTREGKTYDEITLATGVSGASIYAIRSAAGMTRRRGRQASGATLAEVVAAIQSRRFVHVHEDELQEGLAEAFADAGLDASREVRLSSRDRIDFLIGAVGIEVKVAGSAPRVLRQLERYAESDRVEELVLVTDRVQAGVQPETVGGKPLRVVQLLGGLS